MNATNSSDKQRELEALRERVRELEAELSAPSPRAPHWQAGEYYMAYHATTGFMLGSVAAMSSLLFNIIGALLFGKHPLELIRVYLTFPMGAQALDLNAVDNGVTLAIGCCLYLATGMVYGMLFEIVLTRYLVNLSVPARIMAVSALSIGVWILNFYGILAWLQPLLFGGNWIVEQIPWWVGALTHLVFGWTMLLIYRLGKYVPYHLESPVGLATHD
ncbi:MAG: hypothetical protein JNG90_17075 [Planctomycetaceae bacterium]|nr:hypothetical protein [Planctomycetaceae bacterium]